jgi:alpha-aminoadipic semialdehyde synthase
LEAGAEIQEDLSSCDVLFGVKEVPIENLIQNKTYFFFSHTIKAQEYNMPLLDAMFEKNIRMIDYESIREN